MSNVTISTNQSDGSTTVALTVTGEIGTTGFSNITIPNSAVSDGTTPTIFIDDQLAQNQGYTQDADNYHVWYTTHYSTHQISIVFTATGPPPNPAEPASFPPASICGVAIAIVIVAIATVALVLRTRRRGKRDTRINNELRDSLSRK
jgi:hypothetical protein